MYIIYILTSISPLGRVYFTHLQISNTQGFFSILPILLALSRASKCQISGVDGTTQRINKWPESFQNDGGSTNGLRFRVLQESWVACGEVLTVQIGLEGQPLPRLVFIICSVPSATPVMFGVSEVYIQIGSNTPVVFHNVFVFHVCICTDIHTCHPFVSTFVSETGFLSLGSFVCMESRLPFY